MSEECAWNWYYENNGIETHIDMSIEILHLLEWIVTGDKVDMLDPLEL